MVYQAELDDGPKDLRRGFAGNVISFWPKVPGVGNVAVDVSPAPTYQLYKPDGTAIGTARNATVNAVGSPAVSRLDLAVDATDTTTYQLLEHYRADITWTYGTATKLDSLRFTICTAPYVPHLSLNDLLEEVADVQQTIAAQAIAIDSSRTAEQHASVLGVKAWADVYQWLQARLRTEGKIVPRLILERWKIQPTIRAQAMHRLFRAEGGTGRSRELAEEWQREAQRRFSAIGDLDYDSDDNGVQDTTVRSPVEWSCRRSW